MELAFSTPALAWTMLGLALPLLIHFFAKHWQRPQRFAALRFLSRAAEQGRARRLSDAWLLLLRLLIFTLMSLALMAPTLTWTVARNRSVTIAHPDVSAQAIHSGQPVYRLCQSGELIVLAQTCAQDVRTVVGETVVGETVVGETVASETFVSDLAALVTREADIAAITAWVPPSVAVPALRLQPLPVTVNWQIVTVPSLSSEIAVHSPVSVHSVRADASYANLFVAINASGSSARWQVDEHVRAPDLVVGDPFAQAPVLWHDAAVPWRAGLRDGTAYAFHIVGEQLHLQVGDAEKLRQQTALLASLIAITDAWLQRGHAQWQLPVSQLQQWSQPQTHGRRDQPLVQWLVLAALLLLWLERGVVHARH